MLYFQLKSSKLLPIKFSGVLAEIPRDKQIQLLKDLGYNDDEMGVAEFYRDFLSKRNQRPHVEVLEVFAPYDLVEKFFNLDITNQKLVDGSIVLVNGDRIEVDLSKAAQI